MNKIATPTELHTELMAVVGQNRMGATTEDLASALTRIASRLTGQTKVAKAYNLQDLARDMVGDGKAPNLFFVTDSAGKVLAITSTTKSDAVRVAGVVGGYLVEDRKHGEVWGSPEYERAQEASDEDA